MEILTAHNARIEVETAPGNGSRFDVWLPVRTGLTPKRTIPPPPQRTPQHGKRILVIDDDLGLMRAYRRMLCDHDAVVVSRGADALDLLRTSIAFDLVLCDLMMPDMDGPQVHAAIAELAPTVVPRIVFCTGGAFTPRVRKFAAEVDNRIVDKPVTLSMINDMLAAR